MQYYSNKRCDLWENEFLSNIKSNNNEDNNSSNNDINS